MAWYWVVIISLVWIALLYTWSYIGYGRVLPSELVFEDSLIFTAIFLIWPLLVLGENLIHVEWYIWVMLAIEAACLFFLAIGLGRRMNESHRRGIKLSQVNPLKILVEAFLMIVAPAGLAIYLTTD